MTELFVILFPILIADIINPILFAGVVYCLGSERPNTHTLLLLLGSFVVYLTVGVMLGLGFEFFLDWFRIPRAYEYGIEFVVVLLLLYAAYHQYQSKGTEHEEVVKKGTKMTKWSSFVLGIKLDLIALPLAAPYLVWIDQLLRADISYFTIFLFLLLYNILYLLPFAAMILVRLIYKEESRKMLQNINRWLYVTSEKYLPLLYLILALILFEDIFSYFVGYRPYSYLSLMHP